MSPCLHRKSWHKPYIGVPRHTRKVAIRLRTYHQPQSTLLSVSRPDTSPLAHDHISCHVDNQAVSNDQWSWRDALTLAIESLSTYSTRAFEDKHDVADAADIAFQGYKAIVVSVSRGACTRRSCGKSVLS